MSTNTIMGELLESPETFSSVIHGVLMKQYGEDYLYWDPTTVWLELKDDFGLSADTGVVDKLSAAQVIMTSDAFFSRVDAFVSISNTLTTGSPSFSVFDPVTPEETIWAIAEVAIMRDMLKPSPSVKDYVELTFKASQYDIHPIAKIFVMAEDDDYRDKIIQELIRCVTEPTNDLDLFIAEQMADLNYQAFRVGGLAEAVLPEQLR